MNKFFATRTEVLTYCMYPSGTVSRMVVSQLVMCREYTPGTKHLPRSCVLSCLEPKQTSISFYYSSKTFKTIHIPDFSKFKALTNYKYITKTNFGRTKHMIKKIQDTGLYQFKINLKSQMTQ